MNQCNSSDQEWTNHENKIFENTIAELDHNSPNFFENINAILPCKSAAQIKSHYEKLIADIEMIKSGEICTPNYDETKAVDVANDHKRRGAPWTDEEHRSFLVGLRKLGKGKWRAILGLYVQTKTPAQVAAHGRKYYQRVKCNTPVGKRRYSIHDVRIHNSNIVETSARQPTHHFFITHIPRHGHPSIRSAPNPNAPPQMLQQDNVMYQQQYNICKSSWAELANTNNPNLNGNNITKTTCNFTGSSNNNSQMMISNHGSNYTDYGDQSTNYDNLFPESPYWFPPEDN